MIIEELEQIFNNSAAKNGGGGKNNKEAGGAPAAAAAAGGGGVSSDANSFFRFIEIDRLNAILAITHRPQFLKDIETWVLRLDKTNTDGKGGVNVYRAQHVSATQLANTLSNIFGIPRQQSSASIASGRTAMSATNRSSSGTAGSTGNSGSSGMGGGMGGGFGGSGGFGSSGGFGGNNANTGGTNQTGAMGLSNNALSSNPGMMGAGSGWWPKLDAECQNCLRRRQ